MSTPGRACPSFLSLVVEIDPQALDPLSTEHILKELGVLLTTVSCGLMLYIMYLIACPESRTNSTPFLQYPTSSSTTPPLCTLELPSILSHGSNPILLMLVTFQILPTSLYTVLVPSAKMLLCNFYIILDYS